MHFCNRGIITGLGAAIHWDIRDDTGEARRTGRACCVFCNGAKPIYFDFDKLFINHSCAAAIRSVGIICIPIMLGNKDSKAHFFMTVYRLFLIISTAFFAISAKSASG